MSKLFGAVSYLARQYQFVLLVIDADFRKHYGSAVAEMNAIIKNYSSHTSLYLLFEDDYEASFSSWLPHSKRIFQIIANQDKLEKAVQEIIRLELDAKNSQS